jgi:hypothetical protein
MATKKMDISKVITSAKGVRAVLFVLIFVCAGLQSLEPMFSGATLTLIIAILSVLGTIKASWFPSQNTPTLPVDKTISTAL